MSQEKESKRVLNFAEFQDNYDDNKGSSAGNSQGDVDNFAHKSEDFAKPTLDAYKDMVNIAGVQKGPKDEEEEGKPADEPEVTIELEEGPEEEPSTDDDVDSEDDVPSYEEYAKRDKGEEPEESEDDEPEESEEKEEDDESEEEEESDDDDEPEEDDDSVVSKEVDLDDLDSEKYSQ